MVAPAQIRVDPAALRAGLARDGFVVVPDLLPVDELRKAAIQLDRLFDDAVGRSRVPVTELAEGGAASATPLIPEISRPTLYSAALRRSPLIQHCRGLATTITGRAASYVFDHAIYKRPGTGSAVCWHQDAAYSPATGDSQALHFWIPLQDVDHTNGCMLFVRGSHRVSLLPHHKRGGDLSSHALEAAVSPSSLGEVVSCPLKVGGVTVHYSRTLHASGPNLSDRVRRAWILHLGPYGRLQKLMPKALWGRLRAALAR
jgi:hypothetical protein